MDSTPSVNEYIVFRAKGNAYKYVRAAKEWSKVAEACSAMILHDKTRNGYRIVALADDNSVPLESALYAGFESEVRRNFLQWRDGQRILGLKFSDENIAKRFLENVQSVVASIGNDSVVASPLNGSRNRIQPLTPRSSQRLFPRVESMAVPESYMCCVCGNVRNNLILKDIRADGTVEGETLKLDVKFPDAKKKLCTECWIKNLLQ